MAEKRSEQDMRTILSLVTATSLLIGPAATTYVQQTGAPGGAAQLGSSPNA
jgi:hypothetical protein